MRGGSVKEEISEGVRKERGRGEERDKNRSALHKKEDNGKEWKDKREILGWKLG